LVENILLEEMQTKTTCNKTYCPRSSLVHGE